MSVTWAIWTASLPPCWDPSACAVAFVESFSLSHVCITHTRNNMTQHNNTHSLEPCCSAVLVGTRRKGWNLLVELLGEFDHLRGQRHAGFHDHQVSSAGGVPLPLGTLRRPLPLLVLDSHIGAVLDQSLWRNVTTKLHEFNKTMTAL